MQEHRIRRTMCFVCRMYGKERDGRPTTACDYCKKCYCNKHIHSIRHQSMCTKAYERENLPGLRKRAPDRFTQETTDRVGNPCTKKLYDDAKQKKKLMLPAGSNTHYGGPTSYHETMATDAVKGAAYQQHLMDLKGLKSWGSEQRHINRLTHMPEQREITIELNIVESAWQRQSSQENLRANVALGDVSCRSITSGADGQERVMTADLRNTVGSVRGAHTPLLKRGVFIIGVMSLESTNLHFQEYWGGKKVPVHSAKERQAQDGKFLSGEIEPNWKYGVEGVVTAEEKRRLTNMTGVQTIRTEDFSTGIARLTEGHASPHVIAVIEGRAPRRVQGFTTGTQDRYERISTYVNGKGNHAYHNMTFYVRVEKGGSPLNYNVSVEQVTATYIKHEPASDNGVTTHPFNVGLIKFRAKNHCYYYSMIIVHVPNEICSDLLGTHDALVDLATERLTQFNEVVVGYIGDTNFKKLADLNSLPSYCGNIGETGGIVYQSSSGAKQVTKFMQCVRLNRNNKHFNIGQPYMLNRIYLGGDCEDRTDHPSLQAEIYIDAELELG